MVTNAKNTGSPHRSTGRKMLFWLVFVALAFLFQEIVLRVCFPVPEVLNFNRIDYQELAVMGEQPGYLRHKTMLWKSLPDTTVPFEHHLNNYGFRDADWSLKKTAGKKRVLFVGDSFVEGAMAGQDEKLTDAFAAAAPQFEVLNAGMIGIGMDHYCYFIEDAVPLLKPDVVYLVVYGNDLIPEKQFQAGNVLKPKFSNVFAPRLSVLVQQIQAGHPISFRWGGEAQAFLQPVPAINNPWTEHATELKPHIRPDLAVAMQRGDFNFFRINMAMRQEERLKLEISLKERLTFLANYTQQHGCKLVVAYIPARAQVTNYYYQYEKPLCQLICPPEMDLTGPAYQVHQQTLKRDCEALQLPFIDLTPIVKAEEKRGNHLFWNYDEHMRAKGYQLLGKQLATKQLETNRS